MPSINNQLLCNKFSLAKNKTRTLKMLLRIIPITVFVLCFSYCSNKQVQRNSDIPPSNIKVIASVISIDKTLSSGNAKDPCSKAPCNAVLKIESIIGYGSSFGGTLNVGDEIKVKFAYTTAKTTEDLLLKISDSYDGVSVKSKIETNIKKSSVINSVIPNYTIYGYKVL